MNEAIKALKAGDRKSAYRQLRRHLRANPKDVRAWLWMSQATTDPKKQIDALKQVLLLEPNHAKSRAIRRKIHELEKKSMEAAPVAPASPSLSNESDEYPFDDLLAEVRAELQKHRAEKEVLHQPPLSSNASPLQTEVEDGAEHNAQNDHLAAKPSTQQAKSNNLSASAAPNPEEEQAGSMQDSLNENGVDLILELKKSIEEKQQKKYEKKDAKQNAVPIKSAMKVAAPAVSKTTSPPVSTVAKAEKTAIEMEPKSSNRKSLVLWMWGVLLLSVIVVVGVIFIIPNLPLSN